MAREAPLSVVHLVSSLAVGGMEKLALRMAREQQSAGHRAAVLSIRDGPLVEQARRDGIPVRVVGGRQKAGRILRAMAHLVRMRPDILHVHNPPSLPYGVLGRTCCRSRLVMTHHGQRAMDQIGVRAQRRIDALVAVADDIGAALRARGVADRRGNVTVVRNGVGTAVPRRSRSEVRAELGLAGEVIGIIVARIDGFKGHGTLLKALAQLDREDLVVLIAGDGAERAALEAEAQALALDPQRIRFLGFRSDVPELLAAADFFVLPSLGEGLPLAVLEAMAAGLPVIATPVGGVPETFTHRREGLFVPVNDASALADAMRRLADHAPLRSEMGKAGLARVNQVFSFEGMLRQYEDLYYQLLVGWRDR